MNDSTQALAFFAGANSIFQGDVLLTAPNPEKNKDTILFNTLGLNTEKRSVSNNA
jgi:biotin synthase